MPDYLVTWRINADADSPEEAARMALEALRYQTSAAEEFTVTNPENGDEVKVTVSI